jgi:hypothetical protein
MRDARRFKLWKGKREAMAELFGPEIHSHIVAADEDQLSFEKSDASIAASQLYCTLLRSASKAQGVSTFFTSQGAGYIAKLTVLIPASFLTNRLAVNSCSYIKNVSKLMLSADQ